MNTLIKNKKAGFTLLEMVAVIVILSLTTVVGTEIIISLMKGRALINKQSEVLVNGQLTIDRLTKQLRLALPYSLRETNGNRCITFLPVVATAFYLDELPDTNNGFPPSGRSVPISVSPYNIVDGNAIFMSVGAASSAEVYGNVSRSLAEINTLSATTVSLRQNHRWQRNSPEQRFFLTDRPQAFCLINNELRYYRNISQTASQVNLSGSYDLLEQSVDASGRWVRVEDASNGCQHCAVIELQFLNGDVGLTKMLRVALLYAQ